jgi:hypothetical protein
MRAALLALFASTASAFSTIQSRMPRGSVLRAEDKDGKMDLDLEQMFTMFEAADETIATQPTMSTTMSLALPWLPRPSGLNSMKLAGDRGFDPLGLANTKADLIKYRSAEIKHCRLVQFKLNPHVWPSSELANFEMKNCRLAMLAAAGWPISELADKSLASSFGLPVDLVGDGLAPSILNGGLGAISPVYWVAVLISATFIELAGLSLKSELPGDYGFDPLSLYPTDPKEQASRVESELIHGRTAMIAITAFAAQEFVSSEPVTKETPFFFEPIWTFAHDMGAFDLTRGFIEIPN